VEKVNHERARADDVGEPTILVGLLLLAIATNIACGQCRDLAHKVDFKNHRFPVLAWSRDTAPTFRAASPSARLITLKSGSYSQEVSPVPRLDEEDPHVSLSSIVYGDITNDGCPEAIVALHVKSGGTLSWGYLYVYSETGLGLDLISSFLLGDRGSEGLNKVQVLKGNLVVEVFDPDLTSGDCCSDGLIRITFAGKNSQLREISRVRVKR